MSESTSPPTLQEFPKTEGLPEIHISDIRTFKQCRRKWSYSSPMGRNLEPAVPYAPFFTGRAIHHLLHTRYDQPNPVDEEVSLDAALDTWLESELATMKDSAGQLWDAEREIINEQVELITGMIGHYVVWQRYDKEMNADRNLRWIASEMEFHIPIRLSMEVWIQFAGRFDGVVYREADETYWLFESKTTRSIKELKRSLVNDEQAGLYCWAAQQIIGHPIAGVMYNIMRKKEPTWPRLLQAGTLTQQKNCDTTMEVYWEAAKEAHPNLTPEEIRSLYSDMLRTLEEKGNTFFERYEVRRTQRELNHLVQDLLATAKEMLNTGPEGEGFTVLYPNPSWMNCNFCHFRAPCLLQNAGGDVDFILAEEYRPRKGWTDPELADQDFTPTNQTESGGTHEKARLD